MAYKIWQSYIELSGAVTSGASVTVRLASSGSLATIYSDDSGTPLSNPTTSDSNGYAFFYAADEVYQITVSKDGSSAVFNDQILGVNPNDTITVDNGVQLGGSFTAVGVGSLQSAMGYTLDLNGTQDLKVAEYVVGDTTQSVQVFNLITLDSTALALGDTVTRQVGIQDSPNGVTANLNTAVSSDGVSSGALTELVANNGSVSASVSMDADASDNRTITADADKLDLATYTVIPLLPVYTVAGVPTASSFTNGVIIVSNETGGRTLATSDGTNWRRVSDGAVIS